MTDMFERAVILTGTIVFMMFALGSHAVKCVDVLLYDICLLGMFATFAAMIWYLWD